MMKPETSLTRPASIGSPSDIVKIRWAEASKSMSVMCGTPSLRSVYSSATMKPFAVMASTVPTMPSAKRTNEPILISAGDGLTMVVFAISVLATKSAVD